jgi:two-component system, LytTR family, sensor kinase
MKNIFEKIRENRRVVLKHILGWLVYLSYMNVMNALAVRYEDFFAFFKWFMIVIINHIPLIIHFYFTVNIAVTKFYKRKYLELTFLVVLSSVGYFLIRYWMNTVFYPSFGIDRYIEVSNDFFFDTIYLYILWSLYALGYYYFRKAIQHEKDLRILQESQSAAEMSFLTSQINPHFLYNTLNFFYAEALSVLPNLSKGIMLLSDMMRYAINNEEGDGKAPLENEVKHIKNFIEINQLRYGNRLYVHFELIGNTEYRRIMPLILITFVENAFKHGELLSELTPLEISLKIEENHLLFRLKNAIRKGPKEESEGIGLVNTRRRLTVAYPERHQLNVIEAEGFYEVLLKMDL